MLLRLDHGLYRQYLAASMWFWIQDGFSFFPIRRDIQWIIFVVHFGCHYASILGNNIVRFTIGLLKTLRLNVHDFYG